ncbi:MAG: superoxide dismutase family protein, partial [Clostridiales bacterium]|nr:superoxide dismutase family protein [Clostridiales bacterium]
MFSDPQINSGQLINILRQTPTAQATITGSASYPNIHGTVYFYQLMGGVLVIAEVQGLPYSSGTCQSNVFGFHIHDGNSCTGTAADPFANAGGHFNPSGCN